MNNLQNEWNTKQCQQQSNKERFAYATLIDQLINKCEYMSNISESYLSIWNGI